MVKEIAYAELGKFKEEYPDYDILFACGHSSASDKEGLL